MSQETCLIGKTAALQGKPGRIEEFLTETLCFCIVIRPAQGFFCAKNFTPQIGRGYNDDRYP